MSIVTSTLNINSNNKLVSIEPDTFLEANPEFGKASDVSNITNELSSHINDDNNPHNVTKEQIGLGNVNNDSNEVLLGINEYESLITENKTIIGSINENKTNIDTKQNILISGDNISIKNNKISAIDTTYDLSSPNSNGLMSSGQYNKLESIETGAQVNKVLSVANRTGNVVLTKEDVGLNNVDNTSDINKPVSTQTQNELNKKQNILIDIEGITSDTVENALKELKTNINTNTDNIALKANDSEVIKKALLDSVIPESGGSSDNTPSTAAIVNALNNVKSTIVNVFHYKGSKDTYEELPATDNQVGDVWNVVESYDKYPAGTNYAWTGTQWDALGGEIDLTPYQTKEDNTLKTISKTIVAAINENKASIDNHIGDTNNPHNVTKEQIELSNVDNTSDINKPISIATQDALNLKQNITDNDLNTTAKKIVDAINEVNTLTNNKANKATTLSGYGITDAYTKAEVSSDIHELELNLAAQINNGLAEKADINASNINEYVNNWKSKLEIDVIETNLNNKQNQLTAGDNISIDTSNSTISVTGIVPEASIATKDSAGHIIANFYAPLSSLSDKQDKLTTYKETLKTTSTDNDTVQIIARGSDLSGNGGNISLIANSAETGRTGGTIVLNTTTVEDSEGFITLNGKVGGSAILSSISESPSDNRLLSEKAINDIISSIPSQVQPDWNATSGKAEILNKPYIDTVSSGQPDNIMTTTVSGDNIVLKTSEDNSTSRNIKATAYGDINITSNGYSSWGSTVTIKADSPGTGGTINLIAPEGIKGGYDSYRGTIKLSTGTGEIKLEGETITINGELSGSAILSSISDTPSDNKLLSEKAINNTINNLNTAITNVSNIKADLNADNITDNNIISWKTKLGISELETAVNEAVVNTQLIRQQTLTKGYLHCTPFGYGKGSFEGADTLSVIFKTDANFLSNIRFRFFGLGGYQSGFSMYLAEDGVLRFLRNNNAFMSYNLNDVVDKMTEDTNIFCAVFYKTGDGTASGELYVNGTKITNQGFTMGEYPTFGNEFFLNATIGSESGTSNTAINYQDVMVFNFDIFAVNAPYTYIDYANGKLVPITLKTTTSTNKALLILENYTIMKGSSQFIPDISGNNRDVSVNSVTSDGVDLGGKINGDADISIAKLKEYLTANN